MKNYVIIFLDSYSILDSDISEYNDPEDAIDEAETSLQKNGCRSAVVIERSNPDKVIALLTMPPPDISEVTRFYRQ